ncbi:MAG: TetR/AcrR family transcriptional regulator [Burkholderiales bacterium]|nr:TetR/AcrR family transcriptional regulator [Burkholderiales bacterium]
MPSIKLCDIAATVRTRRERRKESRPGELLAAALELFVEKGYAATRVEEVAKRAGVSKGTLFLYFSSKEELFKAVVRENISGRFLEWTQELETYEGSSADLLRRCMAVWWERVGSTHVSCIPKLMMSEGSNFPELAAFYDLEVVRPGDELIRRILQRGIAGGEFRPLDMKYASYLVLAPMLFLTMAMHSSGVWADPESNLDPLEYIEMQVDILLNGMCLQSPPIPPLSENETT